MSAKQMQPVVKLPLWLVNALGQLASAQIEHLTATKTRPPEVLASDRKALQLLQEAAVEAVRHGDHLQQPMFLDRSHFVIGVPLQCKMLVQIGQETAYFEEGDWQAFQNGDYGLAFLARDEQFRRQYAPANEKARHLLTSEDDVPAPPETQKPPQA